MPGFKQLIHEVHRRSLWQVLGIYVVGCWIAYEVVVNLVQGLNLPAWLPAFAIVLFIIGLPIVLATAFIQEGTPLRALAAEDPPAAVEHKPAARLFNWKNAVGGGIVAFMLWGVIAAGYVVFAKPELAREDAELSVAALPFVNMSDDKENEYFADGFHDELLTQLSKIPTMKVISRTSVEGYKNTTKNLRTIANELGVRYVLEGSVQRFGDRVKITAQLIDARKDQHVWAETYERSRADLFAIQTEVATAIAQTMNAELSPKTKANLATRPTENTEAYDFYLRALDYGHAGESAGRVERGAFWKNEMELLEKAVAADPKFAIGYADLGKAHLRLHWYGYDRTEARRMLGKAAIDRSIELAPTAPETQMALGYWYYWGERNFDQALAQFERVRKEQPRNGDLTALIGYVQRRQGKLLDAARNIEKGLELDPRNLYLAEQSGNTYRGAREWASALRLLDRAIALSPDYPESYDAKAKVFMSSTGDVAQARSIIAAGLQRRQADDLLIPAAWVEMCDRKFDAALGLLDRASQPFLDGQDAAETFALWRGYALLGKGDVAGARKEFEKSRALLEALLKQRPDDYRVLVSLGTTYAALGDRDKAITAAQRAYDLAPSTTDAWIGAQMLDSQAITYALLGDAPHASEKLDMLLKTPSWSALTPAVLRIDPRFDKIRSSSQFQALLR